MDWLDQSTENCSVQRTLEVIGEKWTLQVLREAFQGVRRFDAMRDHLGVSDSVLSARLRTLVGHGVLDRTEYRVSGARRRYEYRLTEKGRDLYPVIVAMLSWGDRYRADAEGPALGVFHADCGASIDVELRCARGHRLSGPREAYAEPGPGARPRAR